MSDPSGDLTAEELLAALGQAVIATDPDGTVVFWNAAAERLYGWKADEVLGRDISEVTVPLMSQKVGLEIMEALRQGVPWSGGFPVQRRDGGMFPALVTDAGIYRDGVLVGVVGESINLGSALRPLLERSSDAAIMLTPEGTVTYASPAATPLFGWRPDDLVGQPLIDLVHPADRMALRELILSDEEIVPDRIVDVRVQAGDDWVWVEAAVGNMVSDPDVRGLVCNLRRSERLAQLAERERLVRTMHVGVLQDLFGATLELDQLRLRPTTPERLERVDAAVEAIHRAIQVLREAVKPPEPEH